MQQPIDFDQTQFMQDNAQQISSANIDTANNANAPGGQGGGTPPNPNKQNVPAINPPADPSNPNSYMDINSAGVKQGGIDYYNPQNEDAILKGIFAGTPLSVKSPIIDKARDRYAKYNVLSSLTPDQLGDSILSGRLGVGSQELTDLRTFNPEMFLKTQQYVTNKKNMNEINDMGMGIYNALMKGTDIGTKIKYNVSDTTAPVSDVMTTYNTKIQEMVTSKFGPEAQKFYSLTQELLNNPQIQSQKQAITTLEGKKNKLNEDIFNLDNDVRKVLGSEAPESLISAYIGERTKDISKSIRTIDNELGVYQANLDNYLAEVDTTLEYIKAGWTADNAKKKGSGSGTAQLGSGIEALYNDWKNGVILDQEITNQTIWNKYGLKGKTRAEVLSALAQLTANEGDLKTADDLIGRAGGDYGATYADMTKELLAKNKGVQVASYIKGKYSDKTERVKSLAGFFKNADTATLGDTLKQAGYGRFSGKNKAIKEIKKAQGL